ncbi:MAG TPA: hypothetical protein VF013_03070 [Candidatus Limnocylindria bacterium]
MAGTMPHAIFIETNADGAGGFAAYAAELPGCAAFAADADEAANVMPRRVLAFSRWLELRGEVAPTFVGDNWYEVERADAVAGPKGLRRAAFSLDELSPSDQEFERWMTWLELAREELADAIDRSGEVPEPALDAIARQDAALAAELGAPDHAVEGSALDRLYLARDHLTDALLSAGPSGEGVRRALRLAIADDLHLAAGLRGAGD